MPIDGDSDSDGGMQGGFSPGSYGWDDGPDPLLEPDPEIGRGNSES